MAGNVDATLFRMPKIDIWRSAVIGATVLISHLVFFLFVHLVLTQHGTTIPHLADGMDSEYIPLAHSILAGKFELPNRYFPTSEPVPETFRTPGYPIYIAGIFTIFGGSEYNPGERAQPNTAVYALLLSLSLLAAVTACITYLLARALHIETIPSSIASILFGISPAVIFIPVSGMGSDMLFVLFFTLSLLIIARLPQLHRQGVAALCIGLVLGWCGLIRPSGFFLSLIVLIALPFFVTGERHQVVRTWTIALLGFVFILSPWYIRNGVLTGHYQLSSIPVYSAFFYNIPEYLQFKNNIPINDTRAQLVSPLGDPDPYRLRGFEYTDYMSKVNKRFLRENFFPYAVFHTIKTTPFFLSSGLDVQYAVVDIATGQNLNVPFFPKRHENLSHLVYAGDVVGIVKNVFSFWPATLERFVWACAFTLLLIAPFISHGIPRRFFILCIVLVSVAALLASPVAQPRYRIPIEPIVWISALYSASILIPRFLTFPRSRSRYTHTND